MFGIQKQRSSGCLNKWPLASPLCTLSLAMYACHQQAEPIEYQKVNRLDVLARLYEMFFCPWLVLEGYKAYLPLLFAGVVRDHEWHGQEALRLNIRMP